MRFTLSVILIAAVSLLFASNAVAEPGSQRTVRIAGATYLGDLPTYVADELEFFAGNAVEATIQYSDSGKQNLALLRAGDVEFALMALTPIVLDRLANAVHPDDPVILASLLQSHELTAVIASRDAGIEAPADLREHRIAVESGTDTEFVWWLFEQFHGIDRSSVETVSNPLPEMVEAFVAGRVAAAVLPEPWASRLEAEFERLGKSPPRRFDTGSMYAGRWVLVTTRRYVREHRGVCRDVLKAYRQAIEFIERVPTEAISIYSRRVETDSNVFFRHWQSLDYEINLDWALITSLQEQFRWAREVVTGKKDEPPRVLDLLEPGPLQDIWPQAVKIPIAVTSDQAP
jgi:NitT/TauT family transport system substrate-binding protein